MRGLVGCSHSCLLAPSAESQEHEADWGCFPSTAQMWHHLSGVWTPQPQGEPAERDGQPQGNWC